jgi:hypothetical protein
MQKRLLVSDFDSGSFRRLSTRVIRERVLKLASGLTFHLTTEGRFDGVDEAGRGSARGECLPAVGERGSSGNPNGKLAGACREPNGHSAFDIAAIKRLPSPLVALYHPHKAAYDRPSSTLPR